MRIGEFRDLCLREAESCSAHQQRYFEQSLERFFRTYLLCVRLLPARAAVLSAGAGVAYVERVLARLHQVQFTLLDFPQGVERARDDYSRFGFEAVGGDLSSEWHLPSPRSFDAAFSFEVLEHLPIPPRQHFADLIRYLKPDGVLLVSTPNLARVENIGGLMWGRGILTEPDLAFSPVSPSNQGIHRREYTASEIEDALKQAGATEIQTWYTWQRPVRNSSVRRRLSRCLQWLVPRWRPQLILSARVDGSSSVLR